METHAPVSLHHHTIVPLCPLRQCVVTPLRLYGKFPRLLSSLLVNVAKFTRSFLRNVGNSSQRNTLKQNTFNKPLVLQVVLIKDLLMFLFFSSCDWTPHFCLLFSYAARFPIITPWWRTCWRFSLWLKYVEKGPGLFPLLVFRLCLGTGLIEVVQCCEAPTALWTGVQTGLWSTERRCCDVKGSV